GEFIPQPPQMTTGMLNLNTGEFIIPQSPQMTTGMLNLNTGEFIPQPPQMTTGMLNLNTGEFIPQTPQMNMNMLSQIPNQNLLQNNNPFFDPSMNTYEFDFNKNTNLIESNNASKSQIDFKLSELQKMHNSGLISDEEFLVKKRDLVNKALDNL
ncbi:MAG: SHOCT domain-containing protein, partial [Metamycoplasmataceae bacterium]